MWLGEGPTISDRPRRGNVVSRKWRSRRQPKAWTDGFGADAVLECVGTKESAPPALSIAAVGAMVGRVGVPHDVDLDAENTLYRNVGMRGGPAPPREYQHELLRQVLDGSINPGKVFGATFDLDDIATAYAAMDERRAIKALIKVSTLR